MDPELYAALPPDKKEEYKKMFPKPVDIKITRHIIDSNGNVWLLRDWEPLTIPEEWLSVNRKLEEINSEDAVLGSSTRECAHTCTSEECKPFDLEEVRSLFDKWKEMEAEIIDGSYLLKLADEIHKESMRKEIEEDMERRSKEADEREIQRLLTGGWIVW